VLWILCNLNATDWSVAASRNTSETLEASPAKDVAVLRIKSKVPLDSFYRLGGAQITHICRIREPVVAIWRMAIFIRNALALAIQRLQRNVAEMRI